jgi:hypothetical protein
MFERDIAPLMRHRIRWIDELSSITTIYRHFLREKLKTQKKIPNKINGDPFVNELAQKLHSA